MPLQKLEGVAKQSSQTWATKANTLLNIDLLQAIIPSQPIHNEPEGSSVNQAARLDPNPDKITRLKETDNSLAN